MPEQRTIVIAGESGELAECLCQRFSLAGDCVMLVTDENAAESLQSDGVDVWINVVSDAAVAPAETLSRAAWDASIAGMLSQVFRCAQAAGQRMLPRGKGVILNIVSTASFSVESGHVAGSVLGAGVSAMTETLGVEWAGRGVRVAGIVAGAGLPMRRIPMRRQVTPEEIAEAALFLASEDASYITAEMIRVDGGAAAYQLF